MHIEGFDIYLEVLEALNISAYKLTLFNLIRKDFTGWWFFVHKEVDGGGE